MASAVKAHLTASTLVVTGRYKLCALLVGTDGANDPVVTIYDALTNTAGTEAVPTCTYDASALGLNGVVFQRPIECDIGIYVEITNLGTGEVLVYYA